MVVVDTVVEALNEENVVAKVGSGQPLYERYTRERNENCGSSMHAYGPEKFMTKLEIQLIIQILCLLIS